ncbi:MAG: hypothetical protein AAF801_14565 [Pseudomonadota bacterium]
MSAFRGQPRLALVFEDGTACTDVDTVQRFIGSAEKYAPNFGSTNNFAQKFAGFPHDAHARYLAGSHHQPVFDPHTVFRQFPDRWHAYIDANFYSLRQIREVFPVSETTARNWRDGKGGVNGGHVAIARNQHPVVADRILFAAE